MVHHRHLVDCHRAVVNKTQSDLRGQEAPIEAQEAAVLMVVTKEKRITIIEEDKE